MSMADIPEKLPSVNKPESGTYGEKVDLSRLQAQLPSNGAATGPASGPAPTLPPVSDRPVRPGLESQSPSPVPGLPGALLGPTQRPWEPVTAAPAGVPQQLALTGAQRRLQILDALASSPDVSPEMREWAEMLRRILTGAE